MHDPDQPATPKRPKKPIWKKWWFWPPVVLVVLFVIVGIVAPNPPATNEAVASHPVTTQPPTTSAPQPSTPPPPSTTLPTWAPHVNSQSATLSATGIRGPMDKPIWWDQNHKPASTSLCTAEGEQPIGTERAWALASGAIACYDDQPFTAWRGDVININIYFPTKVSEEQSLAVATSILPPDAAFVATFDGTNTDQSADPHGSCRQSVYNSQVLAGAVRQANPSWTADPAKANIILYSGHATASGGADKAYSPTGVNLASVGIGPENPGGDGLVHC